MLARHVSTEIGEGPRGREFGRRHRESVRSTIGAYERLFAIQHQLDSNEIRSIGRRVGESLSANHPAIVEEILAIADGAGADGEALLAVNARTEVLAGGGPTECSMVGVMPERSNGQTILAQNWDWHPDVAASMVVWTVIGPDGRRFTTLTEAGIVAKIGFNDSGLGLCLNILGSSHDGGVGGTPVHVLCRLILQSASCLEDARAILQGADATASSCFNVAHGGAALGPEMASLELSPAGVTTVTPERGVLLHTNHFLGELGGAEDLYRCDWPDTELRLGELDRAVRRGPDRLDVDDVKASLRSHEAGQIAICCHDPDNPSYADRQATLASVCFQLEEQNMEITDGAPCQAPFRTVKGTRGGIVAPH